MSRENKRYWLTILLLFTVGLTHSLAYNILRQKNIYIETPDGNLYLSIAKNFLQTGHFIQNARPYEIGFVVPFGLPLIYTITLGVLRKVTCIVLLQYALYSITGVLVYEIVWKLSHYKLLGVVASICFYFNDKLMYYANPGRLLTEPWVIFLSVLWVYFWLCCKDKIEIRMVISFILLIIRPVFAPFFIFTAIEAIFSMLKLKKKNRRKSVLFIIMGLVLLINIAVNYRETGNVIFLQNYAGIAYYQANNPSTKLDEYSSARMYEFVAEDDPFWEIYENPELTTTEKSNAYTMMTKEYIFSNLQQVIRNVITKFFSMFILFYKNLFIPSLIFWLIYIFTVDWRKGIALGTIYTVVALCTSMGLLIYRYSIFVMPIYLIGGNVLLGKMLDMIKMFIKRISSYWIARKGNTM